MVQPNSTPFIVGPLRSILAIIATANTDQSLHTGTVAAAYYPPSTANGAYVRDCDIEIPAANTASVVTIGVMDANSNIVAVHNVLTVAVTPSATVAAYNSGRIPLDIYVPAGGALLVATTVAQSTHVRFTVGDY